MTLLCSPWLKGAVLLGFASCIFNLGCFSLARSQTYLRSQGQTLSRDDAKRMTVTQGFYHEDWNGLGKDVSHRYDVKVLQGALVVIDSTTGLMWQRGGSAPQLLDRQEAGAYARSLNAQKFAGFEDWRLPTLEEAMSLMTVPVEGQPGKALYGNELRKGVYHISPTFEIPAAYFVWTTDLEASDRGWVVYFWDGICGTEGTSYHAYVRAVRSIQ